jgi:hypothetical protein
VANCACFKMHIAITTVAINMCGTLKIADHRKGHAGVTGQLISWLFFKQLPSPLVLLGGSLIVAGGIVISFAKA